MSSALQHVGMMMTMRTTMMMTTMMMTTITTMMMVMMMMMMMIYQEKFWPRDIFLSLDQEKRTHSGHQSHGGNEGL